MGIAAPFYLAARLTWDAVYAPPAEAVAVPDNRGAWVAASHWFNDRPAAAIEAARRLPDTPVNRLFRAALFDRLGRSADAVAELAAIDGTGEWRRMAALELARRSAAPTERERLNRCCDELIRESDQLSADNTISLGKALITAGRFAEAAALLSRPLPAEADHWLAVAERGRGRLAKSADAALARLAERAGDAASLRLFADIHRELGLRDRAVSGLKSIASQSHEPTAWRVLADVLAEGNPSEAEAAYRQALVRAADVAAYRGLAELWVSQGRAEEILNLLDELAGSDTGVDRAAALATALRSRPGVVRAVLPVIAARMRQPRDAELPVEPGDLLATLADATDQLAAAEEIVRAGLRTSPPPCEPEHYSTLIRILWARKKVADVIDVCQRGLRSSRATSRVVFHFHLAYAYAIRGSASEAVRHADQAVQLASDTSRLAARLRKVTVLNYLELYADAVNECRTLLEEAASPEDARAARRTLATTYSAMGDAARSEFHLRRVLEEDPDDATALNDLGYHFAEENRLLAEAETMARRALELDRRQRKPRDAIDGDNAAYLDSLAWVRYRRSDFNGAAELLRRALAEPAGRRDAVVWDHLGDVERDRGRIGDAVAAWRTAAALADGDKRSVNDRRGAEIRRKLAAVQR